MERGGTLGAALVVALGCAALSVAALNMLSVLGMGFSSFWGREEQIMLSKITGVRIKIHVLLHPGQHQLFFRLRNMGAEGKIWNIRAWCKN